MKFAIHLSAHITPEWRKQYIQYEEMKAMVYAAVEEAPEDDEDANRRHFAKFADTFFAFCDKELIKINTFYAEKLAEAKRKFASLSSDLASLANAHQQSDGGILKGIFRANDDKSKKGKKSASEQQQQQSRSENETNDGRTLDLSKIPHRKVQEMKLAFSEYYLSLVLLQNYQDLNFTGFRKILKKHDKNLQTSSGLKWHKEHVESAYFYTTKDIDKLIQQTEGVVINELEGGDRQKAMKRLRVPPLGDKQSPWTTFKLGLFSGAFVVLIIAVILSAIFASSNGINVNNNANDNDPPNDWTIVVRLYRPTLYIVIFVFLMGVNVYGWRSSGVNHVLIFQLDPRNHLNEQHLMELAALLGVVWTLSVLTFLFSDYLPIPAFVNPLALACVMILFLLNPTKTFRHEARFWTLRVLGRILCAPFFYVEFADFWVADQLNSLAILFTDLQYLICFYATPGATMEDEWNLAVDGDVCLGQGSYLRPILACLPAWFRFAQCLRRYRDTKDAFPHLVNAGKYSTTFFVVLFSSLNVASQVQYGGFFYAWIICAVISSLYAYAWDIKMDWGLLDSSESNENKFLREEIVYASKGYYYFAIAEDFILRFGWAISLSLSEKFQNSHLVATFLAPLEIFRRFVWNFFRLENEHLNNCGQFRATRDISVAPIDASDQAQIVRMMDEEDGVFAVRKKTAAVVNIRLLKAIESPQKKPLLLHQEA